MYNIREVNMGLDGISINQLRVTPENNSAHLNETVRFNLNEEHKVVDGLSQGQKVDPDREQEKEEDAQLANDYSDKEENEEEQQSDVIKYDLAESNKYILKVEEESNSILIIEKATSMVVQSINANELSNYVGYLSNSQGSIVNRKF